MVSLYTEDYDLFLIVKKKDVVCDAQLYLHNLGYQHHHPKSALWVSLIRVNFC